MLAARVLAYALAPAPSELTFELQRSVGGPRLVIVSLWSLGLAAAIAAAALGLAVLAVRERLALERAIVVAPPRLRPLRFCRRYAVLVVSTAAAFTLLESYVHWRGGLGWHWLSCTATRFRSSPRCRSSPPRAPKPSTICSCGPAGRSRVGSRFSRPPRPAHGPGPPTAPRPRAATASVRSRRAARRPRSNRPLQLQSDSKGERNAQETNRDACRRGRHGARRRRLGIGARARQPARGAGEELVPLRLGGADGEGEPDDDEDRDDAAEGVRDRLVRRRAGLETQRPADRLGRQRRGDEGDVGGRSRADRRGRDHPVPRRRGREQELHVPLSTGPARSRRTRPPRRSRRRARSAGAAAPRLSRSLR